MSSTGASLEQLLARANALQLVLQATFDRLVVTQCLSIEDLQWVKERSIKTADRLAESGRTDFQIGGARAKEAIEDIFQILPPA